MTVLRESPLYQEILDEGIEVGVQQGMKQGSLTGQREALIIFLKAKYNISVEMEATLLQRLERIQGQEPLQSLMTVVAQSSDLDAFMDALDQFARPDAD